MEPVKEETLRFAGGGLSLEGRIALPPGTSRGAVVCHPHPQYGGDMDNTVVCTVAAALQQAGFATLRFNFRGVGASEGSFTGGPGEKEDFKVALDYMRARYPDRPLWSAGFSFGSWIALETGAVDDRVRALIGIAPPVAREGYDFSNTKRSVKPKFFIQGEADDICLLQDMWKFYSELPEPKELVIIDAADHLFDGHTTEVGEAIEDLVKDFNG